jgi:hypothetical protein
LHLFAQVKLFCCKNHREYDPRDFTYRLVIED